MSRSVGSWIIYYAGTVISKVEGLLRMVVSREPDHNVGLGIFDPQTASN